MTTTKLTKITAIINNAMTAELKTSNLLAILRAVENELREDTTH